MLGSSDEDTSTAVDIEEDNGLEGALVPLAKSGNDHHWLETKNVMACLQRGQ